MTTSLSAFYLMLISVNLTPNAMRRHKWPKHMNIIISHEYLHVHSHIYKSAFVNSQYNIFEKSYIGAQK